MIQTNVYGPKNMSEAFIPMIDPEVGRIVNVGSGGGGMHVSKRDEADQKLLAHDSANTTWPQLEEYMKNFLANGDKNSGMGAYGMSKAVLHVYTQIQAKENPKLKINAISPGFIDTAMTAGYGAKLTPEEGTVSIRHCLFKDLEGNGWYYGSDAVRSPLHFMRNPGEPAFAGY
jgi:NAD(P)-dependent dehydrogenase (short-subunit alcohol dehydrogenase family)